MPTAEMFDLITYVDAMYHALPKKAQTTDMYDAIYRGALERISGIVSDHMSYEDIGEIMEKPDFNEANMADYLREQIEKKPELKTALEEELEAFRALLIR